MYYFLSKNEPLQTKSSRLSAFTVKKLTTQRFQSLVESVTMEVRPHSPCLEIVSAFDRHFASFIGCNDGFEVTAQSVDKTVRAVSIIERFFKTLRRLAGFQTRGRGIVDKTDVRD